MARQVRRISDLPEATALAGDELIEIVQDGENHRVRVDDLPGAVQSVQGRTGDVVITADDVGLGSVDNTSDTNKPISTATATALAGKLATTATAADSSKLGGQLPSYYATAAQVGDIGSALDAINGEVI